MLTNFAAGKGNTRRASALAVTTRSGLRTFVEPASMRFSDLNTTIDVGLERLAKDWNALLPYLMEMHKRLSAPGRRTDLRKDAPSDLTWTAWVESKRHKLGRSLRSVQRLLRGKTEASRNWQRPHDASVVRLGQALEIPLNAVSLVERVNNMPYPPTIYSHGWIYGVWYCCYTAFDMNGYRGRFPATLINRITTMFPPEKCRFLHLCCGRAHIAGALNVDVNPLPEVDVVADAETLPFKKNMFDVCLIDPPYSEEDATRYGVSRLVSAAKVMKQLLRVLSPGGWTLWLDEKYPSFDKQRWHLHGLVAVVCGANRRTRVLSMFQKR